MARGEALHAAPGGAPLRPQGRRIEDKGFSIAVHYRQSREKKNALAAILEAAARLGNVRVIGGKQVVNILPDGAPHKGIALERERERLRCDTAIYVGDDETDEDVFALDQPGRLLAIRVGAASASQAPYSCAQPGGHRRAARSPRELAAGASAAGGAAVSRAPALASTVPPPRLGDVLDFMRLIWALDHALQTTSKRMKSATRSDRAAAPGHPDRVPLPRHHRRPDRGAAARRSRAR